MKWIKIDKDNLPEHELLAANFDHRSTGYGCKMVGYLRRTGEDVTCWSGYDELDNCTHYIDIHKYDPE